MARELSKKVDVESLVRGVFRDDWMVKTGIGGVLAAGGLVAILYSFTCLPILAAFWALMVGYCLRCMRLKAANPDCKLPEWNEWGDLFLSGITWIALQTGVWLACLSIQALILAVCVGYAINDKSSTLSLVWCAAGCCLVSITLAVLAILSAYVMVNFAVEENVKAGLAYIKVARSLLRSPGKLICGFLLASGIQFLAVLIPSLTVIGVFLVPSAYFIGTVVSSIVLSRHWNACNEINLST